MSSISSISQAPPYTPVAPAKPVENDKPAVAAAPDKDGDKSDDAANKITAIAASAPKGVGSVVDIRT